MDRPFVVDAMLTAISVGYRNPANTYIADQALPRQSVMGEKFKWTEYPIEEAFNVPDARVGRTGQVQQLEFGGTERTASVEDFGYDLPVPNSDIAAAKAARDAGLSNVDPEGQAVMMGTDTLMNQREVRVAGLIHNPNTYAAGRKIALSGTDRFNNAASKPLDTIRRGMDATLVMRPNTAIIGRAVWSGMSGNPSMVNAVKGTTVTGGIITRQQFIDMLADEGITQLLVGDAWFNTAKPGQSASLARAWGKHMALIHLNPLAVPETGGITFGLTAQFGSKVSGRIEDPDIGLQGGQRIRTGERIKELIVAQDVGYFIQDAVD